MLQQAKITGALAKVKDPINGKSLIVTNRVKSLTVVGNNVNFTLAFPTISQEDKLQLLEACNNQISQIYPDAQVNIHFQVHSVGNNASSSSHPLPQVKNVIAIASGKGGVGKSTLTINLARSLKKSGLKVGILDADLYGPSMPTMMGLQGERPKINSSGDRPQIIPLVADGLFVMSMGFVIEPEQAVVLRGPRLGGIIKQFVQDVNWPKLDILLVDLPPGTGDVQLSLVQTMPLTGVIMVTTPQQISYIDALKAMNMFRLSSVNVPILGVVENMAWFEPHDIPNKKYYIFGQGAGQKLAKEGSTLLLGQIPLFIPIRTAADKGESIFDKTNVQSITKSYLELANNTIKQLNLRNSTLAPTKTVNVSS